MSDDAYLQRAVDLAARSASGTGGPFGSIVVRHGDVLGEGTNLVTSEHDPTAHAEVVAIRQACARVRSHRLDDAVLYCSCEPCPMCLAAAWWARVDRIVFAATRDDAADCGFDDSAIYAEVAAPLDHRLLPIARGEVADPQAPFSTWCANPNRQPY
jgi:guanine deaminase